MALNGKPDGWERFFANHYIGLFIWTELLWLVVVMTNLLVHHWFLAVFPAIFLVTWPFSWFFPWRPGGKARLRYERRLHEAERLS